MSSTAYNATTLEQDERNQNKTKTSSNPSSNTGYPTETDAERIARQAENKKKNEELLSSPSFDWSKIHDKYSEEYKALYGYGGRKKHTKKSRKSNKRRNTRRSRAKKTNKRKRRYT